MEFRQEDMDLVCELSPGAVAVYQVRADSVAMMSFSEGLPRLLGMTHDEYVVRGTGDIMGLVVEQDRTYLRNAIVTALSKRLDVDCSYRVVLDDGSCHWMNVRGRYVGTYEGSPVFLAEFLDTTLETRMHESLLDATSNGIYICDAETRELFYVNQKALDFWGKSDDFFGHTCHEFFRGRTEVCPWCACTTLGDDPVDVESADDPDHDGFLKINCSKLSWYGRPSFCISFDDVSGERRARQELESVVAHLPVISTLIQFQSGRTARSITFSDEFCRLLGVTQEQASALYGDDALVPVHPDDRQDLIAYADRHMHDTDLKSLTHRLVRPDGSVIWVTASLSFFSLDGSSYAYVVYTDITAMKEEEDELRRRYLEEQDYLGSVSGTCLLTARIDLTSNRVEEISGVDMDPAKSLAATQATYDDLLRDGLFASFSCDSTETVSEALARQRLLDTFAKGSRTLSVEGTYQPEPDAERAWARVTVVFVHGPESSDVVCFLTVEDIEDERIDQAIFDKMMSSDECDFVALIDTAKRTVDFRRLSPTTVNPYKGTLDYDVTSRTNAMQHVSDEEREEALRGTAIETIVSRLAVEDSYSFAVTMNDWVGVSHRKLLRYSYLAPGSTKVLAIRTDITETYVREQEHTERLREAYRRAEAANRAKSDFLSRMSHDIRTPLNGIIGMTRIAQEHDVDPAVADCLGKIDYSSRFLLGLVNDVLDVSKAESGKMELHPEPYLMSDFDSYIDSIIKPLCKERNQSFTVETHPVSTVIPIIDILRFNQIMFNLLSNAVKYTPEGGSISLVVDNRLVEGHREEIVATIRDNGIGMSEEFQKRLFEPFSQEGRTNGGRGSGSGLGLAIVKKLVELMDGTISVESTQGQGSTFVVTLRFDYLDAVQATWNEEEERRRPDFTELSGKRVLLCEDHPLNQEIAVHLLKQHGMVVTCAEDGQLGLKAFEDSPIGFYDVILMDVRMPIMNGIDATRAIRALSRPDATTVPIVAMTADAYEDDVRRCLDAGMNGHIAKPVDPDVLATTLVRVCG